MGALRRPRRRAQRQATERIYEADTLGLAVPPAGTRAGTSQRDVPTFGGMVKMRPCRQRCCSKLYPVKAGQTRPNPVKPGEKPGLDHLPTGFGPGR